MRFHTWFTCASKDEGGLTSAAIYAFNLTASLQAFTDDAIYRKTEGKAGKCRYGKFIFSKRKAASQVAILEMVAIPEMPEQQQKLP